MLPNSPQHDPTRDVCPVCNPPPPYDLLMRIMHRTSLDYLIEIFATFSMGLQWSIQKRARIFQAFEKNEGLGYTPRYTIDSLYKAREISAEVGRMMSAAAGECCCESYFEMLDADQNNA